MAATQAQLEGYFKQLLRPHLFKDYCPNGLQVEGGAEVANIVTGVTASLDLIDAAIALKADALLVHHGYFWQGEPAVIRGIKYRRLQRLMNAGVSLWAYHLPLDAHSKLGNNAQLAKRLGLVARSALVNGGSIEPTTVGVCGELAVAMQASDFARHIGKVLSRQPLHIAAGPAQIKSVAWCTGSAQGMINQAIDRGVDAFISGEISEPTVHLAKEAGLHYFSAGHHATERYGVQALGEAVAQEFNLEHQFVDIDNPV